MVAVGFILPLKLNNKFPLPEGEGQGEGEPSELIKYLSPLIRPSATFSLQGEGTSGIRVSSALYRFVVVSAGYLSLRGTTTMPDSVTV